MSLSRRVALCALFIGAAVVVTCVNPNERRAIRAARLALVAQPGDAVSGVTLSTQPIVEIRDSSNSIVAEAGMVVKATIAIGSGTLLGTTEVMAVNGVASFSDLAVSGAGVQVLVFTAEGVEGISSATFIVAQPPGTIQTPATLALQTQPGGATSGLPLATQPVVRILDDAGLVIASGPSATLTVTASRNTGSGILSGTLSVDAIDGVATFTDLQITGAGAHVLGFTIASPALLVTSNGFGVIAPPSGPATQLAIVAQPSSSISGNNLPLTLVELRDATGNLSTSSAAVTASIASGGGTLSGSTTVNATNGAASFANIRISGSGPHTLAFASAGLTSSTSGPINVVQTPASLSIQTQPAAATSGSVFPVAPVIEVLDNAGLLISSSTLPITVARSSGTGTLTGTTTVNAVNGVATFTNLTVTGTGTHTLTFSGAGAGTATSSSFTVTSSIGPPTQLNIATQPSGAVSGTSFTTQPVVQVRDAQGAVVPGTSPAVSAVIASGSGTLSGTTTVNAVNGIATFTDLLVTGTGPHALTFTSSGMVSATSLGFTVSSTVGAGTQLGIVTQPGGAVSGANFTTQPVVQVRDGNNVLVSSSTAPVTAAIASGSGTLSGTTMVNAVNGVATFTDLRITGSGPHTLALTSTGLTGATSTTITLSGTATKLSVATQPSSSAANGATFSQQPSIQLRDAPNNPVNQAGVVVTAAIASGGGTLGGTKTATTNSSGIAAFTDLSVTGTMGDRTLSFSAALLTGTASGAITITSGPATQLSMSSEPSTSAPTGVAFALQPSVRLRDASNNAVSQSGVIVTAAIASGGGTLSGIATATTDVAGVATFANLGITGVPGTRTLSFSTGTLTSATSGGIILTGVATQLTISTPPSFSVPSGLAFPQQPAIQLRDGSGNAVFQNGVVVTASLASGLDTLKGPLTATTNASGIAAFQSLFVAGDPGDRTIAFTAPLLTPATSGPIAVTLGAVPVLLEDFSTYASTAEFLTDPRVIWANGESVNVGKVVLDLTVGYGTSDRSMRYDWPNNNGNCQDYGIRPGRLEIPGNLTHVWVEYVIRFGTTFKVDHGNSGCAKEYKVAFLGDAAGASRYNVPEMQTGQWVMGYPGNESGYINTSPPPFTLWDGQPHVFRIEAKLSATNDGIFKFWVDGQLVRSVSGFNTDPTQKKINWFTPGANLNQGPNIAGMQEWWHKVSVYATDPGW